MHSDNYFDPREKQNHNWAATRLKKFHFVVKRQISVIPGEAFAIHVKPSAVEHCGEEPGPENRLLWIV